MDSLRLPPLRFLSQNSSNELNCVLPPVTPPPRLSPSAPTTPWYNSSTLPSPAPITPDDAKFSPVTHTPPSSAMRALPPPTVLSAPMTTIPQNPIPNTAYQPTPQQYPPSYQSPTSSLPAQLPLPSQQQYPQTPASASALWPPYRSAPSTPSVLTPPRPADSFPDLTQPSTALVAPMHALSMQAQVPLAGPSPIIAKSPVKKTVTTARGVRDVYACPYPNCTRVSTEQSNMKAHMRMHTGEKPYVCRTAGCMKAFRWKSSLTYHEKALHVKQRPFKCSPCRRSFVEKRKLRMHYDLCPVRRKGGEGSEDGSGSLG